MAFAREIIQRILQNVRFRVPKTGEKDSYYTIIGNSLVRISNHCTYMYVWDNYLEKNPKCNNMNIVSIVFEDNDDTFHQNCLVLNRDRKKPIVIEEFVYPLYGNANFLTKDEVKNIIKSLKAIGTTNKFKEVTGKGIVNKRISINSTSQNVSVDNYGNNVYTTDIGHGVDYIAESIYNNQEIKENKKMKKKQVIRLNERYLRQIIKESANKILNEAYGTMPNQDKATMWNLNNSKKGGLHGYYNHSLGRHLSSDEVRKGMYDYEKGEEMPAELQVLLHLSDEVKDVLYDQDYIKFVDERLSKLLYNKLFEVSKICDRLINKAKMNIGQQPDENYFDR